MSDREKLIELMIESRGICLASDCTKCAYNANTAMCDYTLAVDHLISNGVTVGVDTKPLKQYLTQIDEYAGLKLKFLVFKADTGERIENCFVLRPDKDHAAVEALRAYAEATDNKTLADDIYNWVGNGATVKKWIPVSERLPEKNTTVIAATDYGVVFQALYAYDGWNLWEGNEVNITHWMPLPESPKECG